MSIYKTMEFLNELELLEIELKDVDTEVTQNVIESLGDEMKKLQTTYINEICKANIKPEIKHRIDSILIKLFGLSFVRDNQESDSD